MHSPSRKIRWIDARIREPLSELAETRAPPDALFSTKYQSISLRSRQSCAIAAEQMNHDLIQHGFTIVPEVLTTVERQKLIAAVGAANAAGRRGLLRVPVVSELAGSPRILDLVRPHVACDPIPVRTIFFDKRPEATGLWRGIRI
jgi:hypothetical protein